jgi:hypothetical protein
MMVDYVKGAALMALLWCVLVALIAGELNAYRVVGGVVVGSLWAIGSWRAARRAR